MPISLESIQLKLQQRLRVLDSAFERQLIDQIAKYRVDKFAIQEGYISSLWQIWCKFSRDLFINSAQGAITQTGAVTTSPHAALGEMEIAFVAKKLSNRETINHIRPLQGSHQEHTWGDLSKMNLVATGIGCSNSPTILTALSACLRIEDLQLCRNASAHINNSTLQSVRASKVRYNDTKLRHPSDMIYWTDPTSNDFLWKSWIYEIELAAQFAIQ